MFCRLCLYKGNEDNIVSIINNDELARKIFLCVDINVIQDDLPKFICVTCIETVLQWATFKEKCQNTHKILITGEDIKPLLFALNESRDDCNSSLTTDRCPEQSFEAGDAINLVKIESFNPDIEADDVLIKKPLSKKRKRKKSTYSDTSCSSFDGDVDCDDTFNDLSYEYNELMYTCDICSKDFDNCMEYLDHQVVHDGEPVFKCTKCSEAFSTRNDLVEHDKNHKKPCPICGKLLLASSMSVHRILHTDKYRCEHCNSKSNSRANLLQHIITVHTDVRDHICDSCGKTFSSKSALQVHLKSHTDDRQYQCKNCSYAGRTASALYIHMATHANDFCICQICSKSFKSLRNLNDHLRRVHAAEKKHNCTYCDKKFASKYRLEVHLRTHTGVRPYQCKICQKAFMRTDGLHDHMLVHEQGRKFSCNGCGKDFITKRGISRHKC